MNESHAQSANPEDETPFAQEVISRGYATEEQIDQCQEVQRLLHQAGKPYPALSELLQRKEILTAHQCESILRRMSDSEAPEETDPTKETQSADSSVTLGGYRLLKRISKGAMGTVYKAKQVSMDRIVALKVLSRRLSKDQNFVKRFLNEARATARLNHPNIIQGIDVGTEGNHHYFIMEYVDGQTIQKLLCRGGAMDEKRALNILTQITKALQHADKHHMVHRDIKPDNIMLTRKGAAKLCDLGLAKQLSNPNANQTEEGRSIGTPNYISPEQARGDLSIDIRTDIYSLGITLYHMLTGTVPFEGSPAVVMTKHINEELPPAAQRNPDLTESTCLLLDRMTRKNREDRYQTPSELMIDLEALLSGKPAPGIQAPLTDSSTDKISTDSPRTRRRTRSLTSRRIRKRFRR